MQDKLFYKIGEVSEMTGLESYVLRFWESEFPRLHPRKSRGNQRVYTRKEIDLVFRIKDLLYNEGLTITGAKKRLSHPGLIETSTGNKGSRSRLSETIRTVKTDLEDLLHILS